MENFTQLQTPITFESMMALLHESERIATKEYAEIRKSMQETDRRMQENAAAQKETDRLFKEAREQMKEQSKETDRLFKETDKKFEMLGKKMDKTDQQISRTNKQIGGISKSNGDFCEEYFVNSFKENPTFLGQKFKQVLTDLKPHPVVIADQYDLVLHNGTTTVLIEMKYKADTSDVKSMFKKLHSYRANYPMFKDYKTYLGLASFSFNASVRKRAEKEGIVLIQQQGEKIEVISKNIKVW